MKRQRPRRKPTARKRSRRVPNPAKRTKRNAIASAVYARLGHAGVFHRSRTGVHSIYDPMGVKAGESLVLIGRGPTWDDAFADMMARLGTPRRNPSKPSRSGRDEESIRRMAPGAVKRQGREKDATDEWHRRTLTPGTAEHRRHQDILSNQPQWETLEGQWILRVPGQPIAALPSTGKKTAANFIVFNVRTREELTFLKKSEVAGWLTLRAVDK